MEVSSLNFGHFTDYPDNILWFSSVSPGECQDNTLKYVTLPFPIYLLSVDKEFFISFDVV